MILLLQSSGCFSLLLVSLFFPCLLGLVLLADVCHTLSCSYWLLWETKLSTGVLLETTQFLTVVPSGAWDRAQIVKIEATLQTCLVNKRNLAQGMWVTGPLMGSLACFHGIGQIHQLVCFLIGLIFLTTTCMLLWLFNGCLGGRFACFWVVDVVLFAQMTGPNYDSLKVAVLILARGGSKGVPMKNVRDLCGHPLIAWAVNACKKARGIDDVWVSTDSDLIASAASKAGARVHHRAAYTATDDAPSILGIREFVQAHSEYDIVGLVQATSPMVLPEFLEEAVEKMRCGDWDSVFAVKRLHAFLWTDTKDSKSLCTNPINVDPANRPRRQDWPGILAENGMFYFFRASTCVISPFQHGRMTVVEIPLKFSQDIDTELDFKLVETTIMYMAEELVSRGSLAPIGH